MAAPPPVERLRLSELIAAISSAIEMQYSQGYGPGLDAVLGGHLVEITDARTGNRWPDYVRAFLRHGALCLLAVPVPAVPLTAALNVYSPVAGAFTDEHRRAVADLAAYAAVALIDMDSLQGARDELDL